MELHEKEKHSLLDPNTPKLEPEPCFKWRYVVAILGSMGMSIIYGLKVNLSVALVAMVNKTAVELTALEEDHGSGHGGGHDTVSDGHEANNDEKDPVEELIDGPFNWSSTDTGTILSAYFIGYFLTQIPGGRMAELFSGKWVFLAAVLMNIIGTILSPPLSYASLWALVVARVFEGLGGGFTFPAMNVVIAAWSPPQERSTMSSIAFSGASLGTVLSMMSSGIINQLCGWEWIFYIQGGLALVWCVLWVILVSDKPETHHFVSTAEVSYIASTMPKKAAGSDKKPPVPWLKMMTSIPFLTLAVSHFCNNFGWYMLLVEMPLFASTGLQVNMTITTIMSSVPFLANWLWSVAYSKTLDTFIAKGMISTVVARKISVAVASLVPALSLFGIIMAGNNIPVVVTLAIVGVGIYGSMFSGVFSNQADLAPNFAGTLMAVTNMLATIPGILVPTLVGQMTHGVSGLAPWHTVFWMTIGILLFECVIFLIFGKADIQPWNGESSGAPAPSGH